MPVNGEHYSWENIEISLPGGLPIGITEISYSDEKPIEARYGKGSVPRGYGRKNYKASGSMSLDRDEFDRFREVSGGTLYRARPFPIIVQYANEDQSVIVDTLPDCMVTKQDTSGKQDDDNAGAVKLDFIILSPIQWNGESAY